MKHYQDEMPLYAAGLLKQTESSELEKHLAECPQCRSELAFWQHLSGEMAADNSKITAPAGLAERALGKIHAGETRQNPSTQRPAVHPHFKTACLSVFSLLRAQVYLVKRELWPASAGVMALVVIMALLSHHAEAISFAVPLIAAASLASLYGSENDPAHELSLAAPTSAWKILLARLSVVSAYNLLLSLLASLAMLLIIPSDLLGMIILGWLAPLAFLSSLALLLSLWISTGNAVAISYGLWIIQFLQISKVLGSGGFSSRVDAVLNEYHNFWQSPALLLIVSGVLLVTALLSTRCTEHGLSQSPI